MLEDAKKTFVSFTTRIVLGAKKQKKECGCPGLKIRKAVPQNFP